MRFKYLCLVWALSVYTAAAQESVKPAEAEKSVRPGINDRFTDPDVSVEDWLGRFEIESREVYSAREEVLKACQIEPGFRIADVGAGTGFYSRLFSEATGDDGWVYSVDIATKFLSHINEKSAKDGINNQSSVLCTDRSVCLPPESVDLAFTCDTYHHFEYPQSTLASILKALKPGGRFVLIDFERIRGKSRRFIMGHVRAGKQVFQEEITDAGFELEREVNIPEFKENYLLIFRKPESAEKR